MKTRDSAGTVTKLPPAPAPTARDANRWSLSSGGMDGTHSSAAQHRRPVREADPVAGAAGQTRRRPFLQGAAVPLLAALVMGVFAFLRGRKGDSFEDYRGLLIAAAVIAFLVISRLGRRAASRPRTRNGRSGG